MLPGIRSIEISSTLPAERALRRLDAYRRLRGHDGFVGRRRGSRLALAKPYVVKALLRPVVRARLDASGGRVELVGHIRPDAVAIFPALIPPFLLFLLVVVPPENRLIVGATFLFTSAVIVWVIKDETATYREDARDLERRLREDLNGPHHGR